MPGDPSSAAFFVSLALLNNNSSLKVKNVGLNPTRSGLINILLLMGADIKIVNQTLVCNEESADLIVKSSDLHGIEVPEDIIPTIIDEIPILSIAAAFSKGTTIIKNASELRVKESDRLNAISEGLHKLNINHKMFEDGLLIKGNTNDVDIYEEINSFDDHRIAMSYLIAGS